MSLPNALNTFFGSALIIILIIAEFTSRYSSDRKSKFLFSAILILVLAALITDFTLSLNGISSVSAKVIWPIAAAVLLFVYLFIILRENTIDTLTGLDNRFSFFMYFNKLFRNKTDVFCSIAMLDICNFKSINGIYGHLEGDNALCNLAQIIKLCTKKTHFTARYGGDEFILVTKTEAETKEIITSIEKELGKYNEKSNKLYNIEISYGFDTFISDGSKPIEVFVSHIDKLMYKHNEEKRRASDMKTGE